MNTTTQLDFASYKKRITEVTNGEYELLELGATRSTAALFRHKRCGNVFKKTYFLMVKKEGRPECDCYNLDKLKNRVTEATNGEYELTTKVYVNINKTHSIRHKCGHEYEVRLNNFLNQNGSRCPVCTDPSMQKVVNGDAVDFNLYLQVSDHKDRYEFLSEFTGFDEPLKLRDRKCGHISEHTPRDIVSKRVVCKTCQHFFPKKVRTTESLRLEIRMLDRSYSLLSEFTGSKDLVTMHHEFCKTEFQMRPNDFLSSGNRCPKCAKGMSSNSKGAKIVKSWFEKSGFSFYENAPIEGCVYINLLRFDFVAVDEGTNEVLFAVEYDGKQHYSKASNHTWTNEFEVQVERDRIKDEFCKKYGIPLLRIRYDLKENEILSLLDVTFNDYRKDA